MLNKKSFQSVTRTNRFCLQFFGVLPLNGPPSRVKNLVSNCLTVYTIFSISSVIFPVFHLMLTSKLNLEGVLDALNVTVGVFGGELRMILIAMQRRRIHRLMSICEALWNDADNADYKIISVWANRAKSLTNLLCAFTIFAVSIFVILPIIKQLLPGSNIGTRTWPYQINMDATQSPQYELYYVLQTCFVCNAVCSIIGCDSTGSLLAIHACGQLKLIQSWLLSIFENEADSGNGKDEIIVIEKLKKCVQRHQFVMHFCDEIEELVRYPNLAQVLAEMYMMAISASRLSRIQGAGIFKQIGLLVLAAGQIFISCFASEQLSSESVMVAKMAYAIPWYRCSPRIRKMILLIIKRSQRPVRLTIGKFTIMSLATFGSIVSTAISVFMLLRSIDSTASIA